MITRPVATAIMPDLSVELEVERTRVQPIAVFVQSFVVSNDAQADAAANMVRGARAAHKALDERRQEITRPLRAAEKSANDLFRFSLSALNDIMGTLRQRIDAYMSEKAQAQRTALMEASAVVSAGMVPVSVIPAPAEVLGVTRRETWDFEITDATQVPRYLCSPDVAKIGRVLDGCDHDGLDPGVIPGLRLFRRGMVTVRK